MSPKQTIQALLDRYADVRYVAIYSDGELTSQQRSDAENSSGGESDRYEELLVNPAMLKLATQRGEIDCGGLDYLLIRYGHFYQLVRSTASGHISICLDLGADLHALPRDIFHFLENEGSI